MAAMGESRKSEAKTANSSRDADLDCFLAIPWSPQQAPAGYHDRVTL
jgi:hypothetical protein